MIPALAFFLTSLGLFVTALVQYSRFVQESSALGKKRDKYLATVVRAALGKGSSGGNALLNLLRNPDFRLIISHRDPTGFRNAAILFGSAIVAALIFLITEVMFSRQVSLVWVIGVEIPCLLAGLYTFADDARFYAKLTKVIAAMD